MAGENKRGYEECIGAWEIRAVTKTERQPVVKHWQEVQERPVTYLFLNIWQQALGSERH